AARPAQCGAPGDRGARWSDRARRDLPHPPAVAPGAFGVGGCARGALGGVRPQQARRAPDRIYVLVGAGVWLCTLKSGIHPTVAAVLLGLLTPAGAWIRRKPLIEVIDRVVLQLRTAEDRSAEQRDAVETLSFAATEAVSPLERLEHGLHAW